MIRRSSRLLEPARWARNGEGEAKCRCLYRCGKWLAVRPFAVLSSAPPASDRRSHPPSISNFLPADGFSLPSDTHASGYTLTHASGSRVIARHRCRTPKSRLAQVLGTFGRWLKSAKDVSLSPDLHNSDSRTTMQYPQPTNEAPYPQAMPKGDGPSQMHFNRCVASCLAPSRSSYIELTSTSPSDSGQPHAHAPNPHARPSYPHPHPSAHFEHPHYPSSTPFSRFWGWTGSYAVPPPPAGPALGPYPHPHPHTPASVHHHAYFRRSCRPRSRLFVPILLVVGGVVAYKRLQRDIEDVRTQAVDREGRPLRSSTERRSGRKGGGLR
ncbi:hypothetical protein BJY59DRAFT_74183 [Rhodotorula toruloides]